MNTSRSTLIGLSNVVICVCLATASILPSVSFAAANQFSLPLYETVVLKNGLTINLMKQDEVPLITVNAVIRTGAVNDNISGLANLTASGLLLGAGGQSKLKIEQSIDFLGASINAAAGKEGSYVIAEFMSRNSDALLPLVQAIIINPDFDAVEFEKLKQREIAGIERAKESPRNVISRYFDKLVFADHPYGNPVSGNSDSLATITVDDLKSFHSHYYQPANTAISVVGDFDTNDMSKRLETLFGDWQNSEQIKQPDSAKDLPVLSVANVLLVDKSDALESTFIIGGMGISRSNPDYVPLTVINTVLGARFTSWLNDELRVNSGLTYGARSNFVAYSKSGTFQISSFTKTATSKETIDLALKTYARLWETGIDQATLDSAKAYVKGQFPPDYETSSELAGLLSDMFLYGFDKDFINNFESKVDGLTLKESRNLIENNFPKNQLQFVIIGNAAELSDIAATYGKVKQVDIKAVGFYPRAPSLDAAH